MKKDRSYRKSVVPDSARLVFEGDIFDTYQWDQTLYDGSTKIFEKVVRNDTAVIYPVLPDGKILLIKDSQPQRDTIITAPSGRLEEGEKPDEAILRELLEEAGYMPETLVPFYTIQPYEKIDWVVNVFIGKNCKKVQEPLIQAGERIELYPVTLEEMFKTIVEGRFREEGMTSMLLAAYADPKKMDELRKKFAP